MHHNITFRDYICFKLNTEIDYLEYKSKFIVQPKNYNKIHKNIISEPKIQSVAHNDTKIYTYEQYKEHLETQIIIRNYAKKGTIPYYFKKAANAATETIVETKKKSTVGPSVRPCTETFFRK